MSSFKNESIKTEEKQLLHGLKYHLSGSENTALVKLDPGDEITAREIYLVESNEGELYRQRVIPLIHRYAHFMKKGTYSREMALKGIVNLLVPEALRRYKKSQGDIGRVSRNMKLYIAEQWLPSIEDQAKYEAEH